MAFTRQGSNGIWIIRLDSSGDQVGTPENLEGTTEWKLFQPSIDTIEDPPLFAVPAANASTIWRVTNIITLAYYNVSLDFYNYPVDVGRFHFMAVYPGDCNELLGSANYNKAHAIYVSLETKTVDFCKLETPNATCGDGVLDPGEICDDGNDRDGDGCSADRKWLEMP